jgi:hypothetical protein
MGAGAGATIILQDNTSYYALSINRHLGGDTSVDNNVKNIRISGIEFRSEGGFSEHLHQLNINAASDVIVENCKFYAFRGDAIYVGSSNVAATERHNRNITIRNNVFDGVNNDNRNGVSVIDGDGVTIENNTFYHVGKSTMPGAIDIEPNADAFAVIKNITISNNRIHGSKWGVGFALPAVTFTNGFPTGLRVVNNHIDNVEVGIRFLQNITANTVLQHDLVVEGNHVRDSDRGAMYFDLYGLREANNHYENIASSSIYGYSDGGWVRDAKIINNNFIRAGKTGGNAVDIFYASRWLIDGNTFEDCGATTPGSANAIDFNQTGASDNVTIINNTFTSPTGKTTIAIQKEAGHTLGTSSNTFYNNKLNGLTNNFTYSDYLPNYHGTLATWTPVVSGVSTAGTGTYTSQTGHYVTFGNLVWFNAQVAWTAHTGTGSMVLNLPVVPNASLAFTSVNVYHADLTYDNTATVLGLVVQSSGQLGIYANKPETSVTPMAMDSSATLIITGVYTR